jgi:xanthine dehydrogenase accessory factor
VLPTSTPNLLACDDVLADVLEWRSKGLKTVLVTLVAIEGATPRPIGAQMAVAEDGSFSGYISGGCIEEAVAQEALAALADDTNRLVRYGLGSAYFDLKLPCGSGLDLYFDQGITSAVLDEAARLRDRRQAFYLCTDLESGVSAIEAMGAEKPISAKTGHTFRRTIVPPVRVLLVGGGAILAPLATLFTAVGIELDIVTPDDNARQQIQTAGFKARHLTVADTVVMTPLDRWTAAVIVFHEHDWEAPVLSQILKTPCFFIGVMGSKRAHANRLERLSELGVTEAAVARIRCPIGVIPGAKSRATLAVGIVAEIIAEAKSAGMLA